MYPNEWESEHAGFSKAHWQLSLVCFTLLLFSLLALLYTP